jgi:hypothetical protein
MIQHVLRKAIPACQQHLPLLFRGVSSPVSYPTTHVAYHQAFTPPHPLKNNPTNLIVSAAADNTTKHPPHSLYEQIPIRRHTPTRLLPHQLRPTLDNTHPGQQQRPPHTKTVQISSPASHPLNHDPDLTSTQNLTPNLTKPQ